MSRVRRPLGRATRAFWTFPLARPPSPQPRVDGWRRQVEQPELSGPFPWRDPPHHSLGQMDGAVRSSNQSFLDLSPGETPLTTASGRWMAPLGRATRALWTFLLARPPSPQPRVDGWRRQVEQPELSGPFPWRDPPHHSLGQMDGAVRSSNQSFLDLSPGETPLTTASGRWMAPLGRATRALWTFLLARPSSPQPRVDGWRRQVEQPELSGPFPWRDPPHHSLGQMDGAVRSSNQSFLDLSPGEATLTTASGRWMAPLGRATRALWTFPLARPPSPQTRVDGWRRQVEQPELSGPFPWRDPPHHRLGQMDGAVKVCLIEFQFISCLVAF